MAKLTLSDLANLQNDSTAVSAINANAALIETALENTLSRDGTSPNQMSADLDMNSNRILNLPAAGSGTEPVRHAEFVSAVFGDPADFIFATEDQAEEGVADSVVMSPLRTTQLVDAWEYTAPDTDAVGVPLVNILRERVRAIDFGLAMDGVTDDTDKLRTVAQAVQSRGGNCVLQLPANAILRINSDEAALAETVINGATVSTPVFRWIDIEGLDVEGNGCVFDAILPNNSNTLFSALFWLEGVQNSSFDNLRYQQEDLVIDPVNLGGGMLVFKIGSSATRITKHIKISNAGSLGGTAFMLCNAWPSVNHGFPTYNPAYDISVENIDLHSTYYGFDFQKSPNRFRGKNIYSVNAGRTYFPHNVHDQEVDIVSQNGGPDCDILIKSYSNGADHSHNTTSDIKLKYRNLGRHGTTQILPTQNLIGLDVETSDGFACHIRDIHLDLDIADNTANPHPPIIRCLNLHTGTEAHQLHNIKISGRVRGMSTARDFLLLPYTGQDPTDSLVYDWKMENLYLDGVAFGMNINIDGRCLAGAFDLSNIRTTGTVKFNNFSSDRKYIHVTGPIRTSSIVLGSGGSNLTADPDLSALNTQTVSINGTLVYTFTSATSGQAAALETAIESFGFSVTRTSSGLNISRGNGLRFTVTTSNAATATAIGIPSGTSSTSFNSFETDGTLSYQRGAEGLTRIFGYVNHNLSTGVAGTESFTYPGGLSMSTVLHTNACPKSALGGSVTAAAGTSTTFTVNDSETTDREIWVEIIGIEP